MPKLTIRGAAVASLTFTLACSSGLGSGDGGPTPSPGAARGAGMGIDFGFGDDGAGSEVGLSQPIGADYALAGALIPAAGGAPDRRVSFVGFTTASPSNDADGFGSSLTSGLPVTDGNGVSDVFLMALDDGLVSVGGATPRPRAFSQSLMSVFMHSRCVHCHGIREGGIGPVFPASGSGHPGGLVTFPAMATDAEKIAQCAACHGPSIPNSGGIGVEWFAPVLDEEALDFRGKSPRVLSERVEELALSDHLLTDSRVRWAIETGLVPGVGAPMAAGSSTLWVDGGIRVADVGPVPVTMVEFEELLNAWESGGHQATASGAILAVALASLSTGGVAGDGVSDRPAVAWVPNASFNPDGGGTQTAGTVYVAFRSNASNLVGGGSATSDVYRTSYLVRVNLGSAGAPISLVSQSDTVLVSQRAAGGQADDASSGLAMSGDGLRIAFSSSATDLVAGFVDSNGATAADLYVRDVAANGVLSPTVLVSHADGTVVTGGSTSGAGNGESVEASITADGRYVAFASTADDLVVGDGNNSRDVFVADLDAATAVVAASVDSGGNMTQSGPSRTPAIASLDGGNSFAVVFESEAPNLDANVPSTGRHVFLREGSTTRLLSRSSGGGGTAGNGSSFDPAISPIGNEVIFTSNATNLGTASDPDTNGVSDVMLVNLRSLRNGGAFEVNRVNVNALGLQTEAAASGARITGLERDAASPGRASFVLLQSSDPTLGVTAEPLTGLFLVEEDPPALANFTTDSAVTTAEDTVTVQFRDLSTGLVSTYAWDFGEDPSNPGQSVGTSTQREPQFTYTTPGTYDVSLTVTGNGESDTSVQTDLVEVLVPLEVTSLSASSTMVEENESIAFSSVLTRTQGIAYSWVFDDGSGSSAESPNHAFVADGTYNVTLTASDAFGSDTSDPLTITVIEASGAGFTFDAGTEGLRYTSFQDTSLGTPTAIAWDFSFTGSTGNPGATFNVDSAGAVGGTVSHDFPQTGAVMVAMRASYATLPDDYSIQTVNVDAVIFGEVVGSFQTRCNSCHGVSQAPNFGGGTTALYGQLVGVSTTVGAGCGGVPGNLRVAPFSLSNSFLWGIASATAPTCSSMPNYPAGAELELLRDWIEQGAAFD